MDVLFVDIFAIRSAMGDASLKVGWSKVRGRELGNSQVFLWCKPMMD